MESLWNSLSAVLLILLLALTGYLFGRAGWMKKESKPLIVKLIVNIAVPCMCFNNVFSYFTKEMLSSAGALLLVPFFGMCGTFALSLLLAKLLRIPKRRHGGFVTMCGLSNSMFIGYPMCRELFGDAGVPYVMCYYLVNTALFWTAASYLIYRSGDAAGGFSLKGSLKRLLSPPLISLVVTVCLLLIGFEPPHLITRFCDYMGSMVTPLALFYVGFVIYEAGLKSVRLDRDLTVVLAMRFLAAPLLTFLLARAAGLDGIARGVLVIESAMPVMTQSVVVSASAGADEQYNAVGLTVSTLACLVLIPILMWILV